MNTRKEKSKATEIIIISCFISIAYAIIRYHILGEILWKDLPIYILNKGIALSAFILLCINFSIGPIQNLGINVPQKFMNARKGIGTIVFLLTLVHVCMSVLLFTPTVYKQFFLENGTLTLSGGISLLGGIIGFILLWVYDSVFKTSLKEERQFIAFFRSRKFILTATITGGIHLFFMGLNGWMTPEKWYGGLPPISLIGIICFSFSYFINIVGRKT
ncbi:hypothetical protein [Sediminitomix flava]|uniref:Ferric reductase like protein n=1 Tax=Sediminitomix flava TaxID=379075 RepID=A0A315ZAB1_SEDFL|nr:hypothetical protein [Sediminitomix flava]PWJ41778.1 hypothetical protein BC781_10328 [Sediminitomix flava]